MPEEFVTVASFTIPVEAQLAVGRLEEEGIAAFQTGDVSADTFAGMGLGGRVDVQVPQADAARARTILAACAREARLEDDWEARAESDAGVWVCSLCGDSVATDLQTCPSCQTPREAIRPAAGPGAPRPAPTSEQPRPEQALQIRDQVAVGEPPPPAHELEEDGPDLPALTFLGDDLARRACRAAVFGAFTPILAVFTLYSIWLLLRMLFSPFSLGPAGRRQVRWAVFLNAVVCLLWRVVWQLFSD